MLFADMKNTWTEVDEYFGDLLAPRDELLDAALEANEKAGLPAIGVSRLQGKFLFLLVKILQARRVLEIGTLGGLQSSSDISFMRCKFNHFHLQIISPPARIICYRSTPP